MLGRIQTGALRDGPLRLRCRLEKLLHRDEAVLRVPERLAPQAEAQHHGEPQPLSVNLQGSAEMLQDYLVTQCDAL